VCADKWNVWERGRGKLPITYFISLRSEVERLSREPVRSFLIHTLLSYSQTGRIKSERSFVHVHSPFLSSHEPEKPSGAVSATQPFTWETAVWLG